MRFSGWLMRNRLRGGAGLRALLEPLGALRRSVLAFSSPTVSTAFDRSPTLSVTESGEVHIVASFAFKDGTPAGGSTTSVLRITDGALEIDTRCTDAGRVRGLWFRPPARAMVLEESAQRARLLF